MIVLRPCFSLGNEMFTFIELQGFSKRRQPTGVSRKLLLLLQGNPFIINQLKAI